MTESPYGLKYPKAQHYNSMLPQFYQQKQKPSSIKPKNHIHHLLSHIEDSNQKITLLINSFRSGDSASKDKSPKNFQARKCFGHSKSFRIRDRIIGQEREEHRLFRSVRGRNQGGDQVLTMKKATRPSLKLYAELSKVGQHCEQTCLNRDSRTKASFSWKKQNPESARNTYEAFQQKRNKRRDEEEGLFEVQSINGSLLTYHLFAINNLTFQAKPKQIFTFFQSIHKIGNFSQPVNPVVKRYKSCVYYGIKPHKNDPYRGMLWYYHRIWYYGQMLDGKRHGLGIEIDLSYSKVWKGIYVNNKKEGYFHIQSPEMQYYGMLKDNKYHREGHLITPNSQYKGNFSNGLKEGMGWEKFSNRSEYKGQYFNNKFDGQGQLKAQGRYYYKGMFKGGKPDGYGFERTEEYEYLGQFVMGVKQGKGTIKTKDGIQLQCMFVEGLAIDKYGSQKNVAKSLTINCLIDQRCLMKQASQEQSTPLQLFRAEIHL